LLFLHRQNYTVMRYLATILMTLSLTACGNRLSNLEYTTSKVSQAVNECTEAAKNVCTEIDKVKELSNKIVEEDIQSKMLNAWDAHMMLY